MNNKAQKLFLYREGRELIGKKSINLWILASIFFISTLAIGFGSSSLKYLKSKMDDPFIQWIDIKTRQGIIESGKIELTDFLNNVQIQKNYQFSDPQPGYILNEYFRDKTGKPELYEGRCIKANSPLLKKILDNKNTVCQRKDIPFNDDELGLIVTEDALQKLGYNTKKYPKFINLVLSFDTDACAAIGLGNGIEGSYDISFPIIAIVRQLPGMKSFLFSERVLNDSHANEEGATWDITSEDNNRELIICGSNDDISAIIKQLNNDDLKITTEDYFGCWEQMKCLHIENSYDRSPLFYNDLYNSLKLDNLNITRIYNFEPIKNYYVSNPEYYSIQTTSLDSIVPFHNALKKQTGLKLEMATIDAKENFYFVQRMGNTLSFGIIVISILFICVFIYYLLNNHFQRIQKNLGTFKAFGISDKTLYNIYIKLMLGITLPSYLLAFIVAWLLSWIIDFITKIEDQFSWINIWCWQNFALLFSAIIASIAVTILVSKNKLKKTPGNLIYDR